MTKIKTIFPPLDELDEIELGIYYEIPTHYCDNCKRHVRTHEVEIPHDFFDDEPIGICHRCANCDYPLEHIYFE